MESTRPMSRMDIVEDALYGMNGGSLYQRDLNTVFAVQLHKMRERGDIDEISDETLTAATNQTFTDLNVDLGNDGWHRSFADRTELKNLLAGIAATFEHNYLNPDPEQVKEDI